MLDTLEAAVIASNLGSRSGAGRTAARPDIWAMASNWPGHDVFVPDQQAGSATARRQAHPSATDWKTVILRTGLAAVLLAITIFSQQIILSALGTIERVGQAAEIQGAVAKPYANLMADQQRK